MSKFSHSDSLRVSPRTIIKFLKAKNYTGNYEKVKKIALRHSNCRIIKGFLEIH